MIFSLLRKFWLKASIMKIKFNCWAIVLLTLLYKGPIHKPHGIVQRGWRHWSHGQPRWVEPVQQVHQDANEEHSACNARPQRQVEGCQAGKHVHCALGLAQQNAHGIIHVACGEVYNTLPLRRDGQSRESNISSLRETEKEEEWEICSGLLYQKTKHWFEERPFAHFLNHNFNYFVRFYNFHSFRFFCLLIIPFIHK